LQPLRIVDESCGAESGDRLTPPHEDFRSRNSISSGGRGLCLDQRVGCPAQCGSGPGVVHNAADFCGVNSSKRQPLTRRSAIIGRHGWHRSLSSLHADAPVGSGVLSSLRDVDAAVACGGAAASISRAAAGGGEVSIHKPRRTGIAGGDLSFRVPPGRFQPDAHGPADDHPAAAGYRFSERRQRGHTAGERQLAAGLAGHAGDAGLFGDSAHGVSLRAAGDLPNAAGEAVPSG
jgi:hypothetical protein